ncbi:hypothetical protein T492DRAFT_848261 [Pavlovales sp. CCMP2436]|nr:hypothetical protein T492DRAFT_848261 [Pavlovales sp. CCMP2436]
MLVVALPLLPLFPMTRRGRTPFSNLTQLPPPLQDEAWEDTIQLAVDESLLDFGGVSWSVDGNGTRHLHAQALQLSYYFNASIPDYTNGGMAEWELGLVKRVAAINAHNPVITLSYWSTKLNEKDASDVATKDLDVLCMTFAFILLYVCVTLGGFTFDRRKR